METKEIVEKVISDEARVQKLLAGITLLFTGLNGMKTDPKTSVLKTLAGGFLLYKGLEGLDWQQVLRNLEATQENNPLVN